MIAVTYPVRRRYVDFYRVSYWTNSIQRYSYALNAVLTWLKCFKFVPPPFGLSPAGPKQPRPAGDRIYALRCVPISSVVLNPCMTEIYIHFECARYG